MKKVRFTITEKSLWIFCLISIFLVPIISLILQTSISEMNLEISSKKAELAEIKTINSNFEIVINESLTYDNLVTKVSNMSMNTSDVIYIENSEE